jgi:hypothetical protein
MTNPLSFENFYLNQTSNRIPNTSKQIPAISRALTRSRKKKIEVTSVNSNSICPNALTIAAFCKVIAENQKIELILPINPTHIPIGQLVATLTICPGSRR